MKEFSIVIGDLLPETRDELIEFLGGDNGNYDIIPIAVISEPEADLIKEEAGSLPPMPKAEKIRPCIIKTHSFDPENAVYEYPDEDAALDALEEMFEEYLQEELDNHSGINMEKTLLDKPSGYARLEWADGEMTEFALSFIEKGKLAKKK